MFLITAFHKRSHKHSPRPFIMRLTLISLSTLFFLCIIISTGCHTSNPLRVSPKSLSEVIIPDSVRYHAYRLKLSELANNDWEDRQSLFKVYRQYGFGSRAADSANHWLFKRDSVRLNEFQKLERTYGWPRAKRLGFEGVQQAYLIIQHSPKDVFISHFDTLRESYVRGDLSKPNYATYYDRLLIKKGMPQRYGTQRGRRVLTNGQEENYLLPVENLPEVDIRRDSMKLAPLLNTLKPNTLILK